MLIYAAAKSLQTCPTVRPHTRQPTRLPCPWDSPGKNTGVGCHFLLQCMKVKRESEVAQSCPTLCDPMDCSPPGSSIHGILQARVLKWGAIAFSYQLGKIKSRGFGQRSFNHCHFTDNRLRQTELSLWPKFTGSCCAGCAAGVTYPQQSFLRGEREGECTRGQRQGHLTSRFLPFKLFHRKLSTEPGWRSGLFKNSFKFQRTV